MNIIMMMVFSVIILSFLLVVLFVCIFNFAHIVFEISEWIGDVFVSLVEWIFDTFERMRG